MLVQVKLQNPRFVISLTLNRSCLILKSEYFFNKNMSETVFEPKF